jgi:hypothetical protein
MYLILERARGLKVVKETDIINRGLLGKEIHAVCPLFFPGPTNWRN